MLYQGLAALDTKMYPEQPAPSTNMYPGQPALVTKLYLGLPALSSPVVPRAGSPRSLGLAALGPEKYIGRADYDLPIV